MAKRIDDSETATMRDRNKATKTGSGASENPQARLAPTRPRAGPHVIAADGVYTVEDLRRVFGLKASSVRREVRLGRLRISKRCGRYFCLGPWVREWFEDGEVRRRSSLPDTNVNDGESDRQSTG